jgi:hypothetical protein
MLTLKKHQPALSWRTRGAGFRLTVAAVRATKMMKPIKWVHTFAVSLWRRNCSARARRTAHQQGSAAAERSTGGAAGGWGHHVAAGRQEHQGGERLAEASGGAVAVQNVGVVAHVGGRQLQRQQGVRGLAGGAAARHPARGSGHRRVVRRTPAAARCRLCAVGGGSPVAGDRHPRRRRPARKRGPDSLRLPPLPATAGCRGNALSAKALKDDQQWEIT